MKVRAIGQTVKQKAGTSYDQTKLPHVYVKPTPVKKVRQAMDKTGVVEANRLSRYTREVVEGKKIFSRGDALSITTGYNLTGKNNLDSAFKVIEHVTGVKNFGTDILGLRIAAAMFIEKTKKAIFQQHPQLKSI